MSGSEEQVERVARAIRESLVDDPDSDAWVDQDYPLDDFTIDGSVNLVKAARAAIAAMQSEGIPVYRTDRPEKGIEGLATKVDAPKD